MAMTRACMGLVAAAALASAARPVRAQTLVTEVDMTVGASSEDSRAGAVQVRTFGQLDANWRVMLEAAWGHATNPGSDAFGSAYAYDNRLHPVETYVERLSHDDRRLVGVRIGRFRTPFGMFSRSDHAYAGFARAPLVRYGSNWALANTFLETGVSVLAGRPSLYVETSVGMPQDAGPNPRPRTTDVTTRVQAYVKSVIVGASYLNTSPSMAGEFVIGRMTFRGIDARWLRDGVQLRGEYIQGRPFDGVSTDGGYLDVLVHHIGMGPVTAVGRVERLDYDAGPFSYYLRRITAGAKIRVNHLIGVQGSVSHDACRPADVRPCGTNVDVSVTQSFRF
jgi:hypothetical protein